MTDRPASPRPESPVEPLTRGHKKRARTRQGLLDAALRLFSRQDVAATANYGLDFDAVVSRGHIHGVQCHPEKSHRWGEQLLKNFVEL